MQATLQDTVRTLIIPLQGCNLLLPNVAVAEVVPYMQPHEIDGAPEWLLGTISWRGLNIPLISYDRLQGLDIHSGLVQARIAVINRIRPDSGLSFYAVVMAGIPQLKRVSGDTLQEMSVEGGAGDPGTVQVGDIAAVIPDLDALELAVAQVYHEYSRQTGS